jgi:hypothetical protein
MILWRDPGRLGGQERERVGVMSIDYSCRSSGVGAMFFGDGGAGEGAGPGVLL